MTPSPKKWSCPRKIFFHIFSKNVAFFEKIVERKNIRNLISHKKGCIHFRCQKPSPFKRDSDSRIGFLPFSQKITVFFFVFCFFCFFKLLNNKIFGSLFMIKKVTLIFGARRLLSLKNCQMLPRNSFSRFSSKILLFFKKKGYIHF